MQAAKGTALIQYEPVNDSDDAAVFRNSCPHAADILYPLARALQKQIISAFIP